MLVVIKENPYRVNEMTPSLFKLNMSEQTSTLFLFNVSTLACLQTFAGEQIIEIKCLWCKSLPAFWLGRPKRYSLYNALIQHSTQSEMVIS
jgi:hypothetical protein